MKTSSEVMRRARSQVEAELERRLSLARRRLPVMCTHNHRQPLDIRKTLEGESNASYNTITGQTLGLCLLGAESHDWQGTICEDPSDAQTCQFFTPSVNKEQVLRQFRDDLAQHSWVAANMPALWELLWVLDLADPPKPSLWFRLWCYLTRVTPEPLMPKVSPESLLDEVEL